MKKILFFLCGIYNGGTEMAVYNLLRALDKNKYDLYVAYGDKENADIPMVSKILNYAKELDITQKNEIDSIIYCTAALDEIDIIKQNIKYKKAYFWFHYIWEDQEKFLQRVMENKEVDEIIAVGEATKEALLEYPWVKNEEKVVVIPNILDTERIKNGAKESLNTPLAKDLNLVTIARIAPIKRFDRIEKFAEVLKQKQIDFKWFIVGKVKESEYSDYAKEIKARLSKFSEIQFEGEQENPFKYMKACDYTMVLSDREMASLVVNETKIVGTPCVITNFKSAYEQIEDGINGIIIEKDNEQYEKNIEKMLKYKKELKENLKGFEYPIDEILKKWDEKFQLQGEVINV